MYLYRSVAELPSRRLVGRARGVGFRDGAGRDRGPAAEKEARAAVGLGVGAVVVESGLRNVDPLLLPLPYWTAEHGGRWSVAGRRPAKPRSDSLHIRSPEDNLALRAVCLLSS